MKRFLTVREVAAVLRLHESTIRAAIDRGEILAVRIGKHVRVPVAEIERLASADGAPCAARAGDVS